MKKFMSLVIAVLFALGMTTVAFAADTTAANAPAPEKMEKAEKKAPAKKKKVKKAKKAAPKTEEKKDAMPAPAK